MRKLILTNGTFYESNTIGAKSGIGTAYHSAAHEVIHVLSPCVMFLYQVLSFCSFFLLAIAPSVLPRCIASDYLFWYPRTFLKMCNWTIAYQARLVLHYLRDSTILNPPPHGIHSYVWQSFTYESPGFLQMPSSKQPTITNIILLTYHA